MSNENTTNSQNFTQNSKQGSENPQNPTQNSQKSSENSQNSQPQATQSDLNSQNSRQNSTQQSVQNSQQNGLNSQSQAQNSQQSAIKTKLDLIEELPLIVKEGKREVARILSRLESENKITLQTNEFVLPKLKETNLINQTQFQEYKEKQWCNRLIYGDNLLVMQGLLLGDSASGLESMRGKIDLIYIDPPYDSKVDYRTKITLPSSNIEQKPNVLEQFAYSDTWRDGTISYLKMIYPRLALMRELLSERGSIYVHLDWHIGHYVKILMDSIFGKENFRNEIVWKRSTVKGGKVASFQFARNHDVILFYAKSANSIFNFQYLPFSKEYKDRFKKDDNDGKGPYRDDQSIGTRSKEAIEKMLEEGRIFYDNKGKMRIKSYLNDLIGVAIDDNWSDIAEVNPMAKENINYATQKPEALLECIIKASSYGVDSNNDTHPLNPLRKGGGFMVSPKITHEVHLNSRRKP